MRSCWTAAELAADPDSWTVVIDPTSPAEAAARIDASLERGFALVRGFRIDDRNAALAQYELIMAQFGPLLAQNVHGDRLHLVKTQPGTESDRTYGSRGSGELLPHTDQAAAPPATRPRLLGLLCLDRAADGGETRLTSGEAVLQRVLASMPSAAEVLRRDFPFGRDPDGVSDDPVTHAPIIEDRPDGRLGLRYNRYFIEVGARRSARAFDPEELAAMDRIDEALADETLIHGMLLRPGEAVVVDNLAVVHDRTAYVDDDVHQRCLARAWTA
jgi:alpha-ketoglutarate-dependent taurine dioxygenase